MLTEVLYYQRVSQLQDTLLHNLGHFHRGRHTILDEGSSTHWRYCYTALRCCMEWSDGKAKLELSTVPYGYPTKHVNCTDSCILNLDNARKKHSFYSFVMTSFGFFHLNIQSVKLRTSDRESRISFITLPASFPTKLHWFRLTDQINLDQDQHRSQSFHTKIPFSYKPVMIPSFRLLSLKAVQPQPYS